MCCGVVALLGCGGPGSDADLRRGGFEEVFEWGRRMVLEDPADHLLGELDLVVETHDQGLLVTDRVAPILRKYSASGALIAEFGTPGDGPFELRRVGGVAEGADGRVAIVDPRLGRITVLTPSLERDTLIRPSSTPSGVVIRVGDRFVGAAAPGERRLALSAWSGEWSSLWEMQLPSSAPVLENPYWGSVAATNLAAFDGGFAVGLSLLYPIFLVDPEGQVIDSLGIPPASFRRVPVVERGAFSPGSTDRMNAWLASFDVIAALSVVQDSLLVVTHGVMSLARAGINTRHDRVDIYDIGSRRKVAEDIALPQGSRVLAGGSGLYLLVGQPPDPWAIAVANLRR